MVCCKDHEIDNEMRMLVNFPLEAIKRRKAPNSNITELFITNEGDEYQIKLI